MVVVVVVWRGSVSNRIFSENNWTAANVVTCVRALFIPGFLYALINEQRSVAFWLFAGFVALDGVDGFLARLLKQETSFGKNFDLLADFTFGATALFGFALIGVVPLFLFAFMLLLGFLKGVMVLFCLRRQGDIVRSRLAKVNGFLIYVLALGLLLGWGPVFAYMITLYFVGSMVFYYTELRSEQVF